MPKIVTNTKKKFFTIFNLRTFFFLSEIYYYFLAWIFHTPKISLLFECCLSISILNHFFKFPPFSSYYLCCECGEFKKCTRWNIKPFAETINKKKKREKIILFMQFFISFIIRLTLNIFLLIRDTHKLSKHTTSSDFLYLYSHFLNIIHFLFCYFLYKGCVCVW